MSSNVLVWLAFIENHANKEQNDAKQTREVEQITLIFF
jgi:hypothetical protein